MKKRVCGCGDPTCDQMINPGFDPCWSCGAPGAHGHYETCNRTLSEIMTTALEKAEEEGQTADEIDIYLREEKPE